MKLKELLGKLFIGSEIDKKDINPNGDIYYLTISDISHDGKIVVNEQSKIKYTKIQAKYSSKVKDYLEYGDYFIYPKDGGWYINRYQNIFTKKVIPSFDFLILRPIGSYFDSFLKDEDGRLYFENCISKIGRDKKSIDKIFIESIRKIEVDPTKDLIVKKAFEEAKPNIEKTQLKRQPLNPDEINIKSKPLSILSLMKRIDRNAIDLFTEFQRHAGLWSDNAKSRLIESLLVKFPIPSFYFDCTNEDSWLIIDGLQRLTTIHQFYSNQFKLSNLEYLTDENGKFFSDLSNTLQARIEETDITALQILPGTPLRVKYSLFERINTEGRPLTAQELRHAINSFGNGKPSKFLKELTELNIFKTIWNNKSYSRMQDRETALRFVAFKINPYSDYKPGMREFLDESMSKIYNLSEGELKQMKQKFADSLVVANNLFDGFPFRVKSSDNKSIFSNPLFESITVTLSNLTQNQREKLVDLQDITKSLLVDLLKKGSKFNKLIFSKKVNSKEAVIQRFKIIEELFNLVLEDDKTNTH